jgi:hypothetical protein
MYEMQGPCPVSVPLARWLPGWLAVHRPAAGTRLPLEVPVSRFFLRSGVAPGVVPVSGSDVFLLPGTPVAQGFAGGDLKIFWLSTTYPQQWPCCPPEQGPFPPGHPQLPHRRPRWLLLAGSAGGGHGGGDTGFGGCLVDAEAGEHAGAVFEFQRLSRPLVERDERGHSAGPRRQGRGNGLPAGVGRPGRIRSYGMVSSFSISSMACALFW